MISRFLASSMALNALFLLLDLMLWLVLIPLIFGLAAVAKRQAEVVPSEPKT